MKKIELNGESSKPVVGYRCSKGLVRMYANAVGSEGYVLFKEGQIPMYFATPIAVMDKHQAIYEGDTMSVIF